MNPYRSAIKEVDDVKRICPKCGGNIFLRSGSVSYEVCDFCGTQLMKTDLSLAKYFRMNEEESQNALKDLRERFVYTNPLYDPEVEKARILLENGGAPAPRLVPCPLCDGKVSSAAAACPHCGQPIATLYRQPKAAAANQDNLPKCPTCRSTNIQKIGSLERGVSVMAWGLFSRKINKTFKCNNCGHTW